MHFECGSAADRNGPVTRWCHARESDSAPRLPLTPQGGAVSLEPTRWQRCSPAPAGLLTRRPCRRVTRATAMPGAPGAKLSNIGVSSTGGDRLRTVVVGASSGLGRCIGSRAGPARGQDCAAGPPAGATRGGGQGGRRRDVGDHVRRDQHRVLPVGHQAGRRGSGRHRRPRLRARCRPPGAARRHGRGHVAARLRHQRHRRVAGDRRRRALPHRVLRQRRLPVVGERVHDAPVAGARCLRGQQGGAGQARRGLAGRAPRRRLHPGRSWASAWAAKATRCRASPMAGTRSWRPR